nr:MAG TPA: hypothetical protein [Caudoviricetes sp.]
MVRFSSSFLIINWLPPVFYKTYIVSSFVTNNNISRISAYVNGKTTVTVGKPTILNVTY